MLEPLICPNCGAPLPQPGGAAVVSCEFCHLSSLNYGTATVNVLPEELANRSARMIEGLASGLKAGAEPFACLKSAAAEHLGSLGETEALARVVLALAVDFEQQSGARIQRDPMAMTRLVEAYLKCLPTLRQKGEVELNLPFLTATSQGPVHFLRRINPAVLASLAAREPGRADPNAAPQKKRGWWPF